MRFSYSPSSSGIDYNDAGIGKCWEVWHPDLPNEIHCAYKDLGHDGPHEGRGFRWTTECHAPTDKARRFLKCYFGIPNSDHEIWLNDDGTVGMTMRGFEDATRFIHVSRGDD